MQRFDHVDGDGFNNRFANLRHATRSQNLGNQRRRQGAPAATAPPMAPASRSGSAPAPARTRCGRAEGATKHQHLGERFGGRMTGRSCGGSQDHSTLTSHERAAAHSITSWAITVGRISRPSALAVLRLMRHSCFSPSHYRRPRSISGKMHLDRPEGPAEYPTQRALQEVTSR